MTDQRSGDWNWYVLERADMVAFKKLPWVAVDPLDWAAEGVSSVVTSQAREEMRRTVAVLDTGHLEHSLGSRGSDDTGTSG